jgi:hypothetical protein
VTKDPRVYLAHIEERAEARRLDEAIWVSLEELAYGG